MKVLMPPVWEIVWPVGRYWIREYLTKGFVSLSPRDQVNIAYQIEREHPTEQEIDEYVIYTLAKMNFTLSAIREFFSRADIVPKPDVDALYARSVAQQHAHGYAPLLDSTPFFAFLRILRMYLETPSGVLACRSRGSVSVNHRQKVVSIRMERAILQCATEAMRRLEKMPQAKDVIRDLKANAHREFVIGISRYGSSEYYVALSLDWLLRHDLIPKNLSFQPCKKKKRR